MRWSNYYIGQRRVIRKFLFFPLTLNGETRWLEFANIGQEYRRVFIGYPHDNPEYEKTWLDIMFLN